MVALEQYLSQVRIYDPVLDGLRSRALRPDVLRQDRRFAAAAAGEAHHRQRSRNCSHRTIPTCPTRGRSSTGCRSSANARWSTWGWMRCPDAEVAAAVGNSMFSDLVSVAGHIYKFGIDDGLPGAAVGAKIRDQRPRRRIQ